MGLLRTELWGEPFPPPPSDLDAGRTETPGWAGAPRRASGCPSHQERSVPTFHFAKFQNYTKLPKQHNKLLTSLSRLTGAHVSRLRFICLQVHPSAHECCLRGP